ncbi:response regulator receiver [Gemmatirosa kalamazoonensis]|uniref:Response regulator receiver n=1 Tax=Gemmatirosa kalamazoonensis TaxID=861299 RepID=W0RES1_9BACT|nr:response regulator transcription factor [Gemmatirosa kalamazoonensis]AHG87878.1 response regulator receiver [Gemmatirosa kalamazoonensis]
MSEAAARAARILVVEDNEALAAGLRNNLEFEGYEAYVAGDAAAGLAAARRHTPDLIILDLMLPDADGFRVLRALRSAGDATPVLVLTALGDEADKVRGLRVGADDYVTKPFGLMELLARVEALLRRTARATGATTVRFGDVAVCLATHDVTRAGRPVPLRPKEYELLVALLRREGAVAARHELLREVWGYDPSVNSRTVDTHVLELRRKLEADPSNPRHLLTVRKAGYRLA